MYRKTSYYLDKYVEYVCEISKHTEFYKIFFELANIIYEIGNPKHLYEFIKDVDYHSHIDIAELIKKFGLKLCKVCTVETACYLYEYADIRFNGNRHPNKYVGTEYVGTKYDYTKYVEAKFSNIKELVTIMCKIGDSKCIYNLAMVIQDNNLGNDLIKELSIALAKTEEGPNYIVEFIKKSNISTDILVNRLFELNDYETLLYLAEICYLDYKPDGEPIDSYYRKKSYNMPPCYALTILKRVEKSIIASKDYDNVKKLLDLLNRTNNKNNIEIKSLIVKLEESLAGLERIIPKEQRLEALIDLYQRGDFETIRRKKETFKEIFVDNYERIRKKN